MWKHASYSLHKVKLILELCLDEALYEPCERGYEA